MAVCTKAGSWTEGLRGRVYPDGLEPSRLTLITSVSVLAGICSFVTLRGVLSVCSAICKGGIR